MLLFVVIQLIIQIYT